MADHSTTNGTNGTAATTSAPPHTSSEQWNILRPVTLDADGILQTPDGAIKPNVGKSVADVEAAGPHSVPLTDWQKRNNIDPAKQVRLVKLAHMRYQHPDLKTITKFLLDFGMQIAKQSEDGKKIWFRGYGADQYVYYAQEGPKEFLGGTYEVESYAELEKATKIEGGTAVGKIEEMKDAPGGGYLLALRDPEGFPVNLMFGQRPAEQLEFPQKVIVNNEVEKPRVRKFNRFTPGPAAVHKLGHYGLCVKEFEAQMKWYTRNFNLAPTDFLYVNEQEGAGSSEKGADANGAATPHHQRKDVALFAHIDRGEDPVDHHTFFMTTNKTSHVHHCSFEVHDYDTQHLGHQWLAAQGYTSVWGIGRHILGSQIFDYWWDTTGNMVEHYADGDLVNKDTPVGWSAAADEALAVWGPEVPRWFLE